MRFFGKRAWLKLLWLAASATLFQPWVVKADWQIERARYGWMLGITVENADGQKLGTVKDFVLDRPAGELRFAVISTGGLFGLGSTSKIVPVQALSNATAKRRTWALDVSLMRWRQAPVFKRSLLAKLNEPRNAQKIFAAYGLKPAESRLAVVKGVGREGAQPAPDGSQQPSPRRGALVLAHELVGRDVVDRQKQLIGQISDLLLDLSGQKPVLAFITQPRLFKKPPTYAVALDALDWDSKTRLRLEVNRDGLVMAQPLTRDAWKHSGKERALVVFRSQE